MSNLDVILAAASCASTGIAIHLAIRLVRLRRSCDQSERSATDAYRRCDVATTELASLRESVHEIAPMLTDACRRWNDLDLTQWPAIWALTRHVTAEMESWWLLSHALRPNALSDGARATDRFFSPFDGWRPPVLPQEADGQPIHA